MRKGMTVEQKAQARSMYVDAGMACRAIGIVLGYEESTIAKNLRAMGVEMRPGGHSVGVKLGERRNRQYPLNHYVFDNIETDPAAAYFVGLILTDGCIHSHRPGRDDHEVSLSQSSPREDVIYKFQKFLGTEKPINRPKAFEGESDKYMLRITSKRIREALMSYGLTPRKTSKQTVDDRLKDRPDFWRGVFDGDGSIVLSGNRFSMIYGSTSPDLFFKWIAYCESAVPDGKIRWYETTTPKGTKLWRQANVGKIAFSIAESLYEGASVYCDVKYGVYQEAKRLLASSGRGRR